MGNDPTLIRVVRVTAVLVGVVLLVFGVFLFEGGAIESLLPQWGWMVKALLGGAAMGAGAGVGVAGLTGDDRFLEKLRESVNRRGALPIQRPDQTLTGRNPGASNAPGQPSRSREDQ